MLVCPRGPLDADCPSGSCALPAGSGAGFVPNGVDQGPEGLGLGNRWVAPGTVSLTGHSSVFDLFLPDAASANGCVLL